MSEIILNISFISLLILTTILLGLNFIKNKKFGKTLIFVTMILSVTLIHMYTYLNQKIQIVTSENKYNLSSTIIKYHSRINLNKKVFLLRDSFLDKKDFIGVKQAKKSSIEHLFYLTRFQNSKFFNDKNLQDYKLYYQLCLFYSNNNCNHFSGFFGESYALDTNNLRLKSHNIDLLPIDLKYLIIPKNKEEIITLNYNFGKLLNPKNSACIFLFYGAQNQWKTYNKELVFQLKKDNKCFNNLLSNLEITANNETKEILISFLENFDDTEDLDYKIENEQTNLKNAYKENKKHRYSIYTEFLEFIYENKEINNSENLIIQLSYLKNIIKLENLNKEKKLELLNLIESYPDKNINLETYDMNFINEKYELIKFLKNDT